MCETEKKLVYNYVLRFAGPLARQIELYNLFSKRDLGPHLREPTCFFGLFRDVSLKPETSVQTTLVYQLPILLGIYGLRFFGREWEHHTKNNITLPSGND